MRNTCIYARLLFRCRALALKWPSNREILPLQGAPLLPLGPEGLSACSCTLSNQQSDADAAVVSLDSSLPKFATSHRRLPLVSLAARDARTRCLLVKQEFAHC